MSPHIQHRPGSRGFTLVEVLIASTISMMILAAVLTSTLMLGRSGTRLGHYTEMEAQARASLELFARDVRQASAITWNSASSVTLAFPAGVANPVTYARGGADNSDLLRTQDAQTKSLLSGITAFSLTGYRLGGDPIAANVPLADADALTKQLEIQLTAARSRATVGSSTNTVLSARFILRNKPVSM